VRYQIAPRPALRFCWRARTAPVHRHRERNRLRAIELEPFGRSRPSSTDVSLSRSTPAIWLGDGEYHLNLSNDFGGVSQNAAKGLGKMKSLASGSTMDVTAVRPNGLVGRSTTAGSGRDERVARPLRSTSPISPPRNGRSFSADRQVQYETKGRGTTQIERQSRNQEIEVSCKYRRSRIRGPRAWSAYRGQCKCSPIGVGR
jgi:hypothetical protein